MGISFLYSDKRSMRFINTTGNSVNLADIDRIIPYLGQQEQELDTDLVKRSQIFQTMVLGSQPRFHITHANEERIEQNLYRLQHKRGNIPDSKNVPKVIFRGHVAGNTGYSKANRNIFLAMARQGLNMCLLPEQGNGEGQEKTLLDRFVTIPDPDSILVHSCIPTFGQRTDARYSILYTTVESASVPSQFIEACHRFDEIWTTSEFCRDVLVNAGLERHIEIVPNSVDSRFYNEKVKPHTFKPPLKDFKFVAVASWNYRKGWDALLKAYLRTFTGDDPVSLLIVTAYQADGEGHRRYKVEKAIQDARAEFANPAHIARCGFSIPENEMPRVYRACDAFVLPSRGEGFGLPYMEASLCGLPVIATNHSGHTMFLNKENAYLVDIDRLAVVGDGKTRVHYWDGQLFPELSDDSVINDIGRLMRYVYENKEIAVQKNRILQEEILAQYSCDIAGAIARNRLEEIWKQL
jgi:glycosyltransferase involved in cell wall biosynthesis